MNDIDLRQRAEDMPLGVSLRIMSAPASFALPMVQRKPFKPPFQVRPLLGTSTGAWHPGCCPGSGCAGNLFPLG